jgi:hypothetical protein
MRHVAANLDEGMRLRLKMAGLDTGALELQAAVAALLREPALIGRWRSRRGWKAILGSGRGK